LNGSLRIHNNYYTSVVLIRENDEKATGKISEKSCGKKLYFISDTGKQFFLPMKDLSMRRAGDMLIIAIAESAMIENCTLYGLWKSSYFASMRD
jgi:hypothetical protein